ncbi:MAG: hypothetical protein IPJ79_20315 [Bacteroidetes bacterium]|nr:hypothetical protein [Bacteroidota bacterium]
MATAWLINLEQCSKDNPNSINYVSRTEKNNGISPLFSATMKLELIRLIQFVAAGGSVLHLFLQPEPYYTGFHILVLTPKIPMSKVELLFSIANCIRANKYKYNYGRQANKTLKEIMIPIENA